MSQAVVHGGTVYLAGQDATEHASASVTEQTRVVLAKIDALLAAAGTDKSRPPRESVFLAGLARFPELNAVWDGWVAPVNMPCRRTIETKLASLKYAIEIAVIAATRP